jgi:hypothetical protein
MLDNITTAITTSIMSPAVPKTTLSFVASKLAQVEAQENPDTDVSLSSLKATAQGSIEIPQLGEHVLTDWSRSQLGSVLGLSWEKFFSGAGPDERAEDLNRRFRRARGVVRLRTTRTKPEDAPGEGTLRAVVSTTFSSIKDTTVTSMLSDALQAVEPDARIVRHSVTDLSTSFVVKLGETYKVGGPGRVGDVWGGLLVRNSGVGYSKLLVNLHLVRLSCLNGMAAPLLLPAVLRARHRWLEEGQVRQSIEEGLRGVGERLRRSTLVLGESARVVVDDVEAEVRRVLQAAKLPLRFARPILAAYAREPHASRFGISQAITLHAQIESPEVRLQLEDVAGRYVASSGS